MVNRNEDEDKNLIEPPHGLVGGSILLITGCYFIIGLFWPLLFLWPKFPDAYLAIRINAITIAALFISFFQYAATFRGNRVATLLVKWLLIRGTIACPVSLGVSVYQLDFRYFRWTYQLKPVAFSIGFGAAFWAMAILNHRWLKQLRDPANEFYEDNPKLIESDFHLMWVVGLGTGTLAMCSGGFWG